MAEQPDSGKQGRTTLKFSRLREEMTGELSTLVAFPGSLFLWNSCLIMCGQAMGAEVHTAG